ncbi:uncharacterized protein N7498_010954 [Penicillium cinerascens]|uniref:Uncharacterized protein n=1 Tax=Penicillium cinerascens TaxID=70096 RepID=A0A9W9J7I1_9EURO|nr:uncharacterized protein N7498_010954 [Penicillium cinerascens]KAJ5191969.1 hypothetical protein N7498_010954 [Penicillium cinerascens]
MPQVSLFEYLMHEPPNLLIEPPIPPPSMTESKHYKSNDVKSVSHWGDFNLTTIRKYYELLTSTQIPDEPMPSAPLRRILKEGELQDYFSRLIPDRVERALGYAFDRLQSNSKLGPANFTRVGFGSGTFATFIQGGQPDLAYADPNKPRRARVNRLPGELKLFFKWNTAMQHSQNDKKRHCFLQVLSQVNFYMLKNNTRYGYIITNEEMVAIRRLDSDGNLELSTPIPWRSSANGPHPPRLTMLLAFWYLGMLAADNNDWKFS